MAHRATPSAHELTANPLASQQARVGQAALPNPPFDPEFPPLPPAEKSDGNKKGRAMVLNITDVPKNSLSSNYKVPTTKSVNGPGLPSTNQQRSNEWNGRANDAPATFNPPVTNEAANSARAGSGKGKGRPKAKKIMLDLSAPAMVPNAFITSFPDAKPPTIFPKITGDLNLIESRYRVDNRKPNRDRSVNILKDYVSRKIRLTGTVKLHGQHADIVINHDNTIRLQSRNQAVLDENHDIMGFAVAMFSLEENLLGLKYRIESRWMGINRVAFTDKQYPMVIAGEWVGPGVQKNVALDQLPRKYFVITSISVNNVWLDSQLYADIEDVDAGIVHVVRGGVFHEELDVTDLGSCQQRMMALTLEVQKKCPFASSFGFAGKGEGIVWKATQPLGKDPRMWFKTKGPDFAVTRTADLPKSATDGMGADMIERTREFAYATTTEPRLEQAWNVLKVEYNMPMNKQTTKKFMQWVSDDILLEEKSRIKSCKVDYQYLLKCIRWIAEIWYGQRLEENEKSQATPVMLGPENSQAPPVMLRPKNSQAPPVMLGPRKAQNSPVMLGPKKSQNTPVGAVDKGVHLQSKAKGFNAPAVVATNNWW